MIEGAATIGCGWGKAIVRVERSRMGRLAMLPHRLRRPRLVLAHQARGTDNIDSEDRGEAAGGGHCSGTPALHRPSKTGPCPAWPWSRPLRCILAAIDCAVGHLRALLAKRLRSDRRHGGGDHDRDERYEPIFDGVREPLRAASAVGGQGMLAPSGLGVAECRVA